MQNSNALRWFIACSFVIGARASADAKAAAASIKTITLQAGASVALPVPVETVSEEKLTQQAPTITVQRLYRGTGAPSLEFRVIDFAGENAGAVCPELIANQWRSAQQRREKEGDASGLDAINYRVIRGVPALYTEWHASGPLKPGDVRSEGSYELCEGTTHVKVGVVLRGAKRFSDAPKELRSLLDSTVNSLSILSKPCTDKAESARTP